MHVFVALSCLAALLSAGPVQGEGPGRDTGPRSDTVVLPPQADDCGDSLRVNHDFNFENGYSWEYGWLPPYYGAFAEGFDPAPCLIRCAAFWLTQIGYYEGQPLDVYVWDGGVTGPPEAVLWVTHDVPIPGPIAFWPEVSQHDFSVDFAVEREFTIGYWADIGDDPVPWFIAADLDGPGGHPWINIAPGIGYPTGWHHPSMVFGPIQSLGFGVYIDILPTPTGPGSWGRIKSLFAR